MQYTSIKDAICLNKECNSTHKLLLMLRNDCPFDILNETLFLGKFSDVLEILALLRKCDTICQSEFIKTIKYITHHLVPRQLICRIESINDIIQRVSFIHACLDTTHEMKESLFRIWLDCRDLKHEGFADSLSVPPRDKLCVLIRKMESYFTSTSDRFWQWLLE